jgi:transglutaminase-like putative cysteine protease
VVLVITLLLTAGASCAPSTNNAASRQAAPATAVSEKPGAPPVETWEAVFIDGAQVGYAHTTQTPVVEDGRELVRITNESHITLKRFGQTVTQQLKVSSTETAQGHLMHFTSEMSAGPSSALTTGRREGDSLNLALATQGKTQAASIPWNDQWGGFFAAEHSLQQQPMQAGQQRSIRALMPVVNMIGNITLRAADYEETAMLEGTQELLKIERVDELGATKIESIIWTDRNGQVLKSLVPGLGQQAYRTTKDVALRQNQAALFDLGEATTVKVQRRMDRPHDTQRVVYRARLDAGDPLTAFAAGPAQSIHPIDRQTVEVVVRAIRPGKPSKLDSPDVAPASDDTAANNLIQSDSPRILEIAGRVVPDESDPWKVAQALEAFVHRSMRVKEFSPALATAAEVAETLEGDCTEHAVLLAALCRARQIPARVAIGLVYFPVADGGGFAYHMWSEVWISDRWVPLDATLGRGGIGAAHIKLADSNLQGASPLSVLLPVFPVMRRLHLEIVDVQ